MNYCRDIEDRMIKLRGNIPIDKMFNNIHIKNFITLLFKDNLGLNITLINSRIYISNGYALMERYEDLQLEKQFFTDSQLLTYYLDQTFNMEQLEKLSYELSQIC